MKRKSKLTALLLIAITMVTLCISGCGKDCVHTDSDKNDKCDICGEAVEVSKTPSTCQHTDNNADGKCDACGEAVSIKRVGNNAEYGVKNTPVIEDSPLKGKTYYFLGSSVIYGSGSQGESMADFIAKRNGCTAIKEAVSGTKIANMDERSYVARLEKYLASEEKAAKMDALICQLSTNDAKTPDIFGAVTDVTVKDITAFDKKTTYGAIEYIIALVTETWNCPVVFFTNSYYENANYAEMIKGLKQIQEKWGITVIDLFNDEAFNQITDEQKTIYMMDNIHPTRAGYREWWLPKFEEALKALH